MYVCVHACTHMQLFSSPYKTALKGQNLGWFARSVTVCRNPFPRHPETCLLIGKINVSEKDQALLLIHFTS